MTNLEALAIVPPEKAYDILEWLWKKYAIQHSDSKLAIISWLSQEKENK